MVTWREFAYNKCSVWVGNVMTPVNWWFALVLWIPGSSYESGIVILRGTRFKSQTTGPQRTNLHQFTIIVELVD